MSWLPLRRTLNQIHWYGTLCSWASRRVGKASIHTPKPLRGSQQPHGAVLALHLQIRGHRDLLMLFWVNCQSAGINGPVISHENTEEHTAVAARRGECVQQSLWDWWQEVAYRSGILWWWVSSINHQIILIQSIHSYHTKLFSYRVSFLKILMWRVLFEAQARCVWRFDDTEWAPIASGTQQSTIT